MSNSEQKPNVTLEDLIQLKRSERPSAEFWPRFEQELRAKQLAALVEQHRPWWRGLGTRKMLVRLYVPLSAAAVVALAFSSFRGQSGRPVEASQGGNQIALQTIFVPPSDTDSHAASSLGSFQAEVADAAPIPEPALAMVSTADSKPLAGSSETTSTEQLLATSTATVKAAGQMLAQLVGFAEQSPAVIEDQRSSIVEPLAQMATPRDSRRARLLASYVAYDPHAAGSSDAARSRERITRRISDESIYDSISRLGVSGDRVSIKF